MLEAMMEFLDLTTQEDAEMILLLASGMTLPEYRVFQSLGSDRVPS